MIFDHFSPLESTPAGKRFGHQGNTYIEACEKLIAADTVRHLNDKFYGQWLALNVPFRDIDEFLTEDIKAKVHKRYQNFAMALRHAPEYWGDEDNIRKDLQLHAHGDAYIDTVLHKVRAQKTLVQKYLNGEIDISDEVYTDSEEELDRERDQDGKPIHRTEAQKRLEKQADANIQRSVDAHNAEDDATHEELIEDAASKAAILAGIGAPGTGKTASVRKLINKWKQKGARILFVLPTGQLASKMRAAFPDIDVDTCHGGLLLHKELSEALPLLTQYDLIIIDEISMLTAEHFDRIVGMWRAASKLPCLVLLGDFWQLPGPQQDAQRVDASMAWKFVKIIPFNEQMRCKDPTLGRKINGLRTAVPSMKLLKAICAGHRAWKTKLPTAYDILELMRRTDGKTTIVTCTRRGAALVNDLAIQVLYRDRHVESLGVAPLDWESNIENFNEKGQVHQKTPPKAANTAIYKGMKVFLTKNMNKEDDFVNGMSAIVEAYDASTKCLQVRTATKQRLAVHMHTEDVEGCGRVTSFPVRAGYASTIQKVQGATLDHITIWLDVPGCRAAGYVALSRVRFDKDYLIAGVVTPRHFVPAM